MMGFVDAAVSAFEIIFYLSSQVTLHLYVCMIHATRIRIIDIKASYNGRDDRIECPLEQHELSESGHFSSWERSSGAFLPKAGRP